MSPRNHADCVGNYCDAVLSDEIIAGRYVQLAVERHLDDLEHAHQRGLHFDAEIAGKSLRFVEAVCTHQKAEWAGQPFLLSPNQQFILWNLIGWRRADGCRRSILCDRQGYDPRGGPSLERLRFFWLRIGITSFIELGNK